MLDIITNLVPQNKWDIKCPYAMNPKYIVVHNTANDASARNEIQYMITNNNQVSFHYAVDDIEIVQGILEDRNAWHASDGANGEGNRNGIAIEICYSKSGGERFDQAEVNTVPLIVELMAKYNIPIENVKRHYDFAPDHKYCPHRTMDRGWDRFLGMVRVAMDGEDVAPTPQPAPTPAPQPNDSAKYSVGTRVCTCRIWESSTDTGAGYAGDWQDNITRVIPDARHPYLIGDGIGWTDDASIDGDPHIPGSSTSTPSASTGGSAKYSVGTHVCTNTLATSSTGGKVYKGDWSGKITRVIPGAPYPYLLNDGTGWTNDAGIDSDPHTPR